jgi:Ca-activated chloride channel homolog
MSFGEPLFLLGLAPAALFAAWAAFRLRREFRRRRLLFADARRPVQSSMASLRGQLVRLALLCSALAMGLLALCRPLGRPEPREFERVGVNLLVLFDASRSMMAEDAFPSRLERAKEFATQLMARLPGSRVGVMEFSGEAVLMAPLTYDTISAQVVIRSITTELAGRGGTSLGTAVRRAQAYMAKRTAGQPSIVVVLSDGESHDGDAVLDAMRAKAEAGIVIDTVTVGTETGAHVPLFARDAQRVLRRAGEIADEKGAPVISCADPGQMRAMAEGTGGLALVLPAGGSLEPFVDRLLADGIAPRAQPLEAMRSAQLAERYWIPLLLASALLVVELLWPRRGRPDEAGHPPRSRPNAFSSGPREGRS